MSSIIAILTEEISLLDRYVILLEEEQKVLKEGDTKPLLELAQKKGECIALLNALDEQRRLVVDEADADSAFNSWNISTEERVSAEKCWNEVLQKARHAKQLNTLNGQLIAMHLSSAKELLAALVPSEDTGFLYRSNGDQATGNTGSRIIDSA